MKTLEAQQVELTPAEPTKAVQLRQHQEVEVARPQGNPLDMPPALFKEGLERRGTNRTSLIDWIRASLVEGIDFAKIHVVGKSRCPHGNKCKNPDHYSKPTLHKPGAEKICGMLGLQTTFPRLTDYEQACINGTTIKQIILRCELRNEAGKIVGEGVGARILEQDYNDINKSLKMAEKSAHIDATLRTAGLSEVFSQDEDAGFMTPNFQQPEEPPRNSNTRGMTGGNHNSGASGGESQQPAGKSASARVSNLPVEAKAGNANPPARTVPPTGKCATVEQRDRMIEELLRFDEQSKILEYAQKASILLPTETLLDWPLRFVPVTQSQMDLLKAAIRDFFDGDEPVRPFENPEPPATKPEKPNGKPVAVPRDQGVGTWRQVEVPFGKNKGKPLGQLDNRQLRAYAQLALEDVSSPTFTGRDDKEHQKSPTALAKAKEWLKHLEAAAAEMGFTVGGDE